MKKVKPMLYTPKNQCNIDDAEILKETISDGFIFKDSYEPKENISFSDIFFPKYTLGHRILVGFCFSTMFGIATVSSVQHLYSKIPSAPGNNNTSVAVTDKKPKATANKRTEPEKPQPIGYAMGLPSLPLYPPKNKASVATQNKTPSKPKNLDQMSLFDDEMRAFEKNKQIPKRVMERPTRRLTLEDYKYINRAIIKKNSQRLPNDKAAW
jgi:hypothetical protein